MQQELSPRSSNQKLASHVTDLPQEQILPPAPVQPSDDRSPSRQLQSHNHLSLLHIPNSRDRTSVYCISYLVPFTFRVVCDIAIARVRDKWQMTKKEAGGQMLDT